LDVVEGFEEQLRLDLALCGVLDLNAHVLHDLTVDVGRIQIPVDAFLSELETDVGILLEVEFVDELFAHQFDFLVLEQQVVEQAFSRLEELVFGQVDDVAGAEWDRELAFRDHEVCGVEVVLHVALEFNQHAPVVDCLDVLKRG